VKIFDVKQGHPEWHALRRGKPTASEFGRIITPAKGEYAAGAETYVAELAAEALGAYRSFQGTPDTDRGIRMEEEAVDWLELDTGIKTRKVGFCLSDCGRFGASPDRLFEDGTPLEVKCPQESTLISWRNDWIDRGIFPLQHKAQVHGEMLVTGAPRCVFMAYTDNPYIQHLRITVERDEFTERLGAAVLRFCDRLEFVLRREAGSEYDVLFPSQTPNPAAA
jgi:hypothetical protein